MKYRHLMAGVGLVAGCFGLDPTEVPLGEEFELAPNQSTRIVGTDLTVGFRRVVGDGRCPLDAVCVVEGKAGIELGVFGASTRGPVLLDTALPAKVTEGRYVIEALDLRPYPALVRGVIRPEDYRLRLVVNLAIPQ
jgi:hypothetical protein